MINHILIIDDNRLVREGIAKILLACGLKKESIASVENGYDAIDFIDYCACDLVICGDNLSDIPASQVLMQISKKGPVKCIALQEASHLLSDMSFLTAEQHQVLQKPFNQKALLLSLLKVTNDNRFTHTDAPVAPQVKKNQTTPELLTPSTILIVDDAPANIDVVSGFLKSSYRLMAARSGKQALEVIKKHYQAIDLILLDIMMPEMDGYEVCKALKSNNKTSHIPIIFLTAKNEIADITKGFDLGAVDYITKPLQGEILLSRVATHVNLQKSQKLLAKQVDTLKESIKLREDVEKITQHDLKGPLSSILFEIEKVTDQAVSNKIRTSVNNVVNMINHSLNVFKIEQGTYQLTPIKTDLSPIILDAVNACIQTAKDKNIVINTEGLHTSTFVFAEPLLCLSLFNNLIKNAVEASPVGKVVTISLLEDNAFKSLCIINDGVIPVALRHNLFDKYVTSDTRKGTGLGTYSAKLMTEMQRGHISFDVIDEKSTLFTVKLPAYRE